MFDIEQVILINFRSFRGEHKVKFPTTPGLYLITGDNQAEPRLAANGVGKSTVFDAINWCLYGSTTRGLKAADVVNWDEKSCSVTTTLQVSQERLTVKRVQAPNSLTLDGKPVSQGALEEHLRIGPEAFTYAVLMPQFGDKFFDLRPEPKLKVFTEIMELDFWLQKAKVAEELSSEIQFIKSLSESEVGRLNDRVAFLRSDINDLKEQDKTFVSRQRQAISKAQELLAECLRNEAKVAEEVAFAKAALANVERKQAKLPSKTCPTCKQPVHNKDAIALEQNKRDFERKLLTLEAGQAREAHTRRTLEQGLEAAKAQANPYAEQVVAKQGKIKAAKARLLELEAEMEALDEDHAAASYWVTGFKRVRLFLVEETLRKLEVEVNNSVSSLGLTEWRVEFDIERENKSGGVTKGFAVLLYPPKREQPVRFEAYSGGETQRLRLAGDLGLANLIMERAGLASRFEVYDEPASFLSEEGLLDVAETLQQRALSTGKRIFLVDHSAMDFAATGRLLVVKDGRGSRIDFL